VINNQAAQQNALAKRASSIWKQTSLRVDTDFSAAALVRLVIDFMRFRELGFWPNTCEYSPIHGFPSAINSSEYRFLPRVS
jgi:hypothetical protein